MASDFSASLYGLKNPFDTPERKAFRETIESFVAAEIKPHVFEWDEAGSVPWALHEKLGALGIWGFGIDEKYGGLGWAGGASRSIRYKNWPMKIFERAFCRRLSPAKKAARWG